MVRGSRVRVCAQAGALLAEELAGLDVDEVRSRSARYLALREARDLQSVLYGGS